MRLASVLSLAVLATATFRPVHAAPQGAPPKLTGVPPQSSPPPGSCFELRYQVIRDADYRWARVQAGDKWITGCVGTRNICIAPIWVRC